MMVQLSVDGKPVRALLTAPGVMSINGKRYEVDLAVGNGGLVYLKIGTRHYRLYLKALPDHHYQVWIKHYLLDVKVIDERDRLLAQFERRRPEQARLTTIKAPMPGVVTRIAVKKGETITIGEGVLVLEAMKMENEIRSPLSGRIRAISVKENTAVEKDQPLVILDPD